MKSNERQRRTSTFDKGLPGSIGKIGKTAQVKKKARKKNYERKEKKCREINTTHKYRHSGKRSRKSVEVSGKSSER